MLKPLVDYIAKLDHFNTYQILVEDSKVIAVRLLCKPKSRVRCCYKPNIVSLGHVINGFAVRSVSI